MSTAAGAQTIQQLQQDLQNELTTANQLLVLISRELQLIKHMTRKEGEFEKNIQQRTKENCSTKFTAEPEKCISDISPVTKNSSLLINLGNLQQIDLEKVPPMTRKYIDMSNNGNHNVPDEQHEVLRNDSSMEEN